MSLICGRYEAAFALDDPDAIVGAALSCPACLAGGSAIEISYDGPEPIGHGTCGACAGTWTLTFVPQQLLRLSLDPPSTALVRWAGALPSAVFPSDLEGGPHG